MQLVAATWLVYRLTGSAAGVGLLAALKSGPAVVGAPLGGILAERWDPRLLSIVLLLLQAIPPAGFAAAAAGGEVSAGLLYLVVFAGEIPGSLNSPVTGLIMPFTVPATYRHAAVARTSMIYNINRLCGAVVGGFVVNGFGAAAAFAFNSASFLIAAFLLVQVRLIESPIRRPSDAAQDAAQGRAANIRIDGWAHRAVHLTAIGMAVFFTLIAPVEQLMPTVAKEHGEQAYAVGVMIGSIALGAIVGNRFIARIDTTAELNTPRIIALGTLVGAAGMVILAVTPHHGLAIDIFAAAAIGFGWEFVFVGAQALVAVDVPPDIRGRMMGLFYVMVSGTAAIGAVVLGLLIDHVGLEAGFLLTSAIAVVVCLAMYVSWRPAQARKQHVSDGCR